MKRKPKNNTREQLFSELVKMLKIIEIGERVHEEHRVERGELYTKRKFETTSLSKGANASVKIEIHTWGRAR